MTVRRATLGIAIVLVALGSGAVAEERSYPTLILDEEQPVIPHGMVRSVMRADQCHARIDLLSKGRPGDEWFLEQRMYLDLDTIKFDFCNSSAELPSADIQFDFFICGLTGTDEDLFDNFFGQILKETRPIKQRPERYAEVFRQMEEAVRTGAISPFIQRNDHLMHFPNGSSLVFQNVVLTIAARMDRHDELLASLKRHTQQNCR